MRAICPKDGSPDIYVDFPDGTTSGEMWRFGCRPAGDQDIPSAEDFVATGVVNLGTPAPQTPRFAQPDPVSFNWDLGNVLATVVDTVKAAVLTTPRMAEPNPVVLDFSGGRFTDTGVTQTPLPWDEPVIARTPEPVQVVAPTAPKLPPPPVVLDFTAEPVNYVATAVVDLASTIKTTATQFFAAPTPPVLDFSKPAAPVEPAAPPANRPRPASVDGFQCCRQTEADGSFTYRQLPAFYTPEQVRQYGLEPVADRFCNGGSDPVEPPVDPPPLLPPIEFTDVVKVVTEPVKRIVDFFLPPTPPANFITPAPVTDTSYSSTVVPTAIVTDTTDPTATDTTTTAKPCSCHRGGDDRGRDDRGKMKWLLLIAAVAYLVSKK